MTLRYANTRIIEAADPDDDASWDAVWLHEKDFGELERRQLVALMAARGIAEDAVFTTKSCDFEAGEAEVPIEWCDVVDETGSPKYALWVIAADSGILFEAGTTDVVTEVIQDGASLADKSLAAALDAAKGAHRTSAPDSCLAQIPALGWS